eukprot:6260875-Pyramimonas_sp.AAC.1
MLELTAVCAGAGGHPSGLDRVYEFTQGLCRIIEENYPALTGGWSGCPNGQLGFPGNPAAIIV